MALLQLWPATGKDHGETQIFMYRNPRQGKGVRPPSSELGRLLHFEPMPAEGGPEAGANELPLRSVGEAQDRERWIVALVHSAAVVQTRVHAAVAFPALIFREYRESRICAEVPAACALHIETVELGVRAALTLHIARVAELTWLVEAVVQVRGCRIAIVLNPIIGQAWV
jgi:hypothetical protein